MHRTLGANLAIQDLNGDLLQPLPAQAPIHVVDPQLRRDTEQTLYLPELFLVASRLLLEHLKNRAELLDARIAVTQTRNQPSMLLSDNRSDFRRDL